MTAFPQAELICGGRRNRESRDIFQHTNTPSIDSKESNTHRVIDETLASQNCRR
jgi:hypothetical protein